MFRSWVTQQDQLGSPHRLFVGRLEMITLLRLVLVQPTPMVVLGLVGLAQAHRVQVRGPRWGRTVASLDHRGVDTLVRYQA